ncbi:MAG: phospholipase A [Desulfobacteraceae bacterium]|nr:phospholipase A [Desulfobacteraceae bacterium]
MSRPETLLLVAILAAACCTVPETGLGGKPSDTGAKADNSHENSGSLRNRESLFSLYQPYVENISAYQPMYFLIGTDPEESKFQISLKYRFLSPDKQIAEKHPWIKNFFLAYTQTTFWDLDSTSQPFKDTSYKPELFFVTPDILSFGPDAGRLFLQTGFKHESNGRDGPSSRSTNYAYVRPNFIYFHPETQIGVQVSAGAWTYVRNHDDTNPDLDEYRGYFDLEIKAGRAEGLVLTSNARWAKKGGSLLVDATYPLHRILPFNLDIYLQAQYVNALAESLLEYRERTRAFRLGISIVR